jgi:hypothetical protein
VLSRPPQKDELADLRAFLDRQAGRSEQQRWTALARVLLNLDEAITKE